MEICGNLQKMIAQPDAPIRYQLPIGEKYVDLNAKIGQTIRLTYSSQILCQGCGASTNKSYAQGHCFMCMRRLARCDMCIMKPEQCHYHKGTCREPKWGEEHCMMRHVVYLANTSGLKVGITRGAQIPTRWIDQGATQALPIFEVNTRLQSGLVEVVLAEHVADKTNWRALLKGPPALLDMEAERDRLWKVTEKQIAAIEAEVGGGQIRRIEDQKTVQFEYPVEAYPEKIKSIGFDKVPDMTKRLMGIKGQYLIFDNNEVMNVRKHTGYQICMEE